MTRTEITQKMQKLTEEIQTLSYSSTKAAAEKILQLQQRRRELRAQFEAAEPSGATTGEMSCQLVTSAVECSPWHGHVWARRQTTRRAARAHHRLRHEGVGGMGVSPRNRIATPVNVVSTLSWTESMLYLDIGASPVVS